MKIKNIIFDLGGVIINIDYTKTSQAFKSLGVLNFDEFYTQSQQEKIFDDFETGKMNSSDFRKLLRNKLDLQCSDEQIDAAWNAMLLDLPIERLNLVKSLQKKYRTFLFSNTNEIHLPEVYNICKKENGISSFEGIFEKEYYSHIFGKRKPHASSFTSLLKENSLSASETLFVDDSYQHIQGAKEAGLFTIHLKKDMSILDIEKYISGIEQDIQNNEKKSEVKSLLTRL